MPFIEKIMDYFSSTEYIDSKRYIDLHPLQKLGASKIPSLNGIYKIEKSSLHLFEREI